MASKSVFVFGLTALVQVITGDILGNTISNIGNGCSCGNVQPVSGGGFYVQSFSPLAPTGIQVQSENYLEGNLNVNGQLPFLTAIALNGEAPTTGNSAVSYGCGNGNIGIISETSGQGNPSIGCNGLGGGFGNGFNGLNGGFGPGRIGSY